ncbi:MAG: radical SAM protein [Candidatus Cloacimonetes bacterium]|nr:radical SAM protein [Candidatus Cloacimonadota bacterium]
MFNIIKRNLQNIDYYLSSLRYIYFGFKVKYPETIQWHITTKCQNNCKHCYMYDPITYEKEQERTLSLKQKKEIIKEIDRFGAEYGISFNHYVLIGGDPLLEDEVFELVKYLRRNGKTVSFGGNPETLTDKNCKLLKKLGIVNFQLSLDGLEETHDMIRGKGSFKRTIAGYEQLHKYGIHTTTMFTVTNMNVNEFFDIIDFVYYNTKSKGIAFDFCSHVGNAREVKPVLSPELVFELSQAYLELKNIREKERPDFHFAEKPGFFRMLRMHRREIAYLEDESTDFIAGCLIGCRCQCILSDGSIVSCRRFPEILGRLPEDSFESIYLQNETLKKYRRPQFYKDCGECIGWNWCRGCPAVSYGEHEDPFQKPSICYSHLLNFNTYKEHKPIPMESTLAEEAEHIKNNTRHNYFAMRISRKFSKRVLAAFSLIDKQFELSLFIEKPNEWFMKNAPNLNFTEQKYVVFHYNRNALELYKKHKSPRWP